MVSRTNIYLTEDDFDNVLLFNIALKEICAECTLTVADNGEELLHKLNKAKQLPDIIFLDINMPGLNGHETLQAIRADERFSAIRVIMCSTSKKQDCIQKAYELGANYYIVKPMKFDVYRDIIRMVLMTDWEKSSSGNIVIQ